MTPRVNPKLGPSKRRVVVAACLPMMILTSRTSTAQDVDSVRSERTQRAMEKLQLRVADVQELTLLHEVPDVLTLHFAFEQSGYTLRLEQFSLRSPDFDVLVQQNADGLESVVPPPPHTYRGEILERPGSQVAASINEGEVTALILLPGATWHIQPLPPTSDDPVALHAIYDGRDVFPAAKRSCNVGASEQPIFVSPGVGNGGGSPGAIRAASIAFDADFEYFQANGSSISATILDIEDILNGVDLIYRTEVDIAYILRTIIVRANANDPYTSGQTGVQMRDQFRDYWIANHGNVTRDVAHLMSGRVSTDGYIGFAYFAGICNANNGANSGYAWSQSQYTTTHARFCLTDAMFAVC